MRDYKKYEVWQLAHALTLSVYKDVLPILPKQEQFELNSQFKRAIYSVPLNIAEGCGRSSDAEFARFLDIALGSVNEAEYCNFLFFELGFLCSEKYVEINEKINSIKSKLINLIKSIRSKS